MVRKFLDPELELERERELVEGRALVQVTVLVQEREQALVLGQERELV